METIFVVSFFMLVFGAFYVWAKRDDE